MTALGKIHFPFFWGLVAFVFLPNAFGVSNTEEEIIQLIKEEKKELGKLKPQIKKQNKELRSLGKQESSLLEKLSYLENKLKLKERELKIYQWNAQVSKKKLDKMNQNINKTQEEL